MPSDMLKLTDSGDSLQDASPDTPAASVIPAAQESPFDFDASDDPESLSIQDEAAYFKAQNAKLRRLLQRSQREMAALHEQAARSSQLETRLKALETEAIQAKQEADSERVARLRAEAISAAGLPAEAAHYLTGSDAASIQEQVEGLLRLFPVARGRIGNAASGGLSERAQQLYERASGSMPANGWDAIRGE